MNLIRDYLKSIRVEVLKTKRTLALLLAIVAPFTVVLLNFLMYMDRDQLYGPDDIDPWEWFVQGNMAVWIVLMLIMYTTLITALVNFIEHSNNTWKQLFSLPISKFSIYFSKLTISIILILLSHIIFGVLIVAAGLLLSRLNPDLGIGTDVPWKYIGKDLLLSFTGSMAIVTFHHWVSMRWTNIIVAFAFGMIVLIMNFVIFSSDYAVYFPWSYSHLFLVVSEEVDKVQVLVSSIASFFLFGIIGFVDMRRKEIV